jgi:hypothetical protein
MYSFPLFIVLFPVVGTHPRCVLIEGNGPIKENPHSRIFPSPRIRTHLGCVPTTGLDKSETLVNKVKNDDKEITQPIEKGVRPRPVRPLLRRQTDI